MLAQAELPRKPQRVEKLLRALLCPRFGSRIRRFRSVLDLFSGSLGEPTGPTTTFSTSWRILRTSLNIVPVVLTQRFVAGLSCCLIIFCIGLMETSVD